jgi:hypothetical protein
MNHRPYCAATAGALLVLALTVGNPFRCRDASGPTAGASSVQSAPQLIPLVVPLHQVQSVSFGDDHVVAQPAGLEVIGHELADPDVVGPCPQAGLPAVVRRARSADGWDTWWHVDGSITKRGVRAGESLPRVLRVPAMKPQQ